MRLEPIPGGSLPPALERDLSTALEYEGWQEAETLYAQVHAALASSPAPLRARALMDHARVLRRVERNADAAAKEAEAEALVGSALEREEEPRSSVDELEQGKAKPKGIWSRLWGGKP